MPQRATSSDFPANARKALADVNLQKALEKMRSGFVEKRLAAAGRLPEFDALRDASRDIKDHVLANLDYYLERFEARVIEQGGEVHWCVDAAEARDAILGICQAAGARTVTKSKSRRRPTTSSCTVCRARLLLERLPRPRSLRSLNRRQSKGSRRLSGL